MIITRQSSWRKYKYVIIKTIYNKGWLYFDRKTLSIQYSKGKANVHVWQMGSVDTDN